MIRLKRRVKIVFLTGLFAFVSAANSQVYQWKDPDSRTTRISNTAPRWYGSIEAESRAPRVQVYYYGVLIDDTNIAFETRLAMRSQSPIGRYLPRLMSSGTTQARR